MLHTRRHRISAHVCGLLVANRRAPRAGAAQTASVVPEGRGVPCGDEALPHRHILFAAVSQRTLNTPNSLSAGNKTCHASPCPFLAGSWCWATLAANHNRWPAGWSSSSGPANKTATSSPTRSVPVTAPQHTEITRCRSATHCWTTPPPQGHKVNAINRLSGVPCPWRLPRQALM
jgi:hypothetical protein